MLAQNPRAGYSDGMVQMIEPPTLDDIERLAREAFATIPDELRAQTGDVTFLVTDFAEDDVLDQFEAESPFEILGLYAGIPFGEAESMASPSDLNRIFLYRRPILDYWCESGEDLQSIVRHVLIHEIGHHFGFSDDDMEAIEATAD
jgi:predicted Zn-dependent protease with MMP-like domain